MREDIIREWVYQQTHQVERTMSLSLEAHCTNDGANEYSVRLQIRDDSLDLLEVFIGQDAISFVEELQTALEEN